MKFFRQASAPVFLWVIVHACSSATRMSLASPHALQDIHLRTRLVADLSQTDSELRPIMSSTRHRPQRASCTRNSSDIRRPRVQWAEAQLLLIPLEWLRRRDHTMVEADRAVVEVTTAKVN
jgi:hypothetical protein